MPTRGHPVYLNLLVLGAYSGLPARCGALGRGSIDGTFALQVQQQEDEGHENVLRRTHAATVELSFVMTGFNYTSLSASSDAADSFTSKVADSVCVTFSLPAAVCQVTLSAAPNSRQLGEGAGVAQSVGGIRVHVNIAQDSVQDAQDIAAQFERTKDAITTSLELALIRDTQIMDHGNGDGISVQNFVASTVATNPASTGDSTPASSIGDPHITSVAGKKFDVNMPGSYTLIRAPQDQRLPAKLEMNATLEASAGSPCGLYIKSVELGGEWLGNQVVSIVPLQRNIEGQNGAGNITLRPFSVRIQEVQRGASRVEAGQYEQWGNLGKEGRNLSGRVRLVPAWRQVYADAGSPQEAQAFQFHIRGDGGEYVATLEAAQAAHQALDIRAFGLRSLGFEHLGGLLGTEEHDKSLEQFADVCKAFRAKSRQSRTMSPAGSSMAASWNAPL